MPTIIGMARIIFMFREKIALRFTEERARLGFSQADFARKLAISREGLRKYENGQTQIGTELLAAAATLGLDVQYVICGVRSSDLNKIGDRLGAENGVPIPQSFTVGVGVGIAHNGSNINLINTNTSGITETQDHVIDENQLLNLQILVKEIVKTDTQSTTERAVWSQLNSYCKVSKQSEIFMKDYDKATKYLHQWIGRLKTIALEKTGDSSWRTRKYAYIRINTENQQEALAVRQYMENNFFTNDIKNLNDEQLQRLYKYIVGRKRNTKII